MYSLKKKGSCNILSHDEVSFEVVAEVSFEVVPGGASATRDLHGGTTPEPQLHRRAALGCWKQPVPTNQHAPGWELNARGLKVLDRTPDHTVSFVPVHERERCCLPLCKKREPFSLFTHHAQLNDWIAHNSSAGEGRRARRGRRGRHLRRRHRFLHR
jgi:hypothetical protein